jgi:predicted metalloprotease
VVASSHRAPSRARAVLALVLGLVVALSGCTISVSTGSPPAPATGGVDRPVSTDAERTGNGQRAEDEQTAVREVNGFWERHFTELTGRDYDPPRVAGPYTGNSGPRCAGQPSVPGNAYYCPAGDFLAWDENLMRAGYDRIGDAWVYLIIAHEWGHAIQARLRRGQVSVAAELQADCLAGAALQGAVDDGRLTLEAGDTEEISQTLVVVSDAFPWTDESSHGNARQRTSAFSAGASGGVPACIG